MHHSEDGEHVAPRHANADIVHHRISYGDRRITSAIRFAELHHRAPMLWVGIPIMWPEGGGERAYGEMAVQVRRHGPAQGTASFGGEAECDVRSVIRYDVNRVRLSMPARCLGLPRWIRAHAAAYTQFPQRVMVDTSPDNLAGDPGVRLTRG